MGSGRAPSRAGSGGENVKLLCSIYIYTRSGAQNDNGARHTGAPYYIVYYSKLYIQIYNILTPEYHNNRAFCVYVFGEASYILCYGVQASA